MQAMPLPVFDHNHNHNHITSCCNYYSRKQIKIFHLLHVTRSGATMQIEIVSGNRYFVAQLSPASGNSQLVAFIATFLSVSIAMAFPNIWVYSTHTAPGF